MLPSPVVVAQIGAEVFLGQAGLLPSTQTLIQRIFFTRHEPPAIPLITALFVCVYVRVCIVYGWNRCVLCQVNVNWLFVWLLFAS